MKSRITVVFLIAGMISGCSYHRIKLVEPSPELDKTTSYAVELKNPQLIENADEFLDQIFLMFHKNDVVEESELQKIGEIELRDNSNKYQQLPIYLELEDEVKGMGGNYVVIEKLKQSEAPIHKNKLKASVYYVDSVEKYELSIKWSPDRELVKTDFRGKESIGFETNYLKSRMVADKTGYAYLQLLNEFNPLERSCKPCSELELIKENIEFDLIELNQREATRDGVDTSTEKHKSRSMSSLKNTDNDADIVKLIRDIKLVTDIKELNKLSMIINDKIVALNKYREKKLPIVMY